MAAGVIIHLVVYAAIAAFVIAVAYRGYRIWRMPLHLRWELYPVAHEPGRAKYGGSALEEVDWWEKPRKTSLAGELKYMIPEMTLLVALFEHNRKMWYRSFPFHFGLYILAGFLGLLILGSVLELLPDPVYVGPLAEGKSFGFGVLIYYLTVIAAAAGLGLATLGVLGLLQIRLTDRVMKNCTSASHIFNLLFFLTVLVLGWIIMTAVDPGFTATRSFLQSLIAFDLGETPAHPVLFAEVILTVLLIAYIPMTHMSHFFMKWFTYHKVRWDDEPNVAGGMVERKVAQSCTYPVTWAAPHINADGKKNWVDIATEEIE